jgi:hypothetical protein
VEKNGQIGDIQKVILYHMRDFSEKKSVAHALHRSLRVDGWFAAGVQSTDPKAAYNVS